MNALLWGAGIFLFSFALHILVWKAKLPYRQTRALLLVFFGTCTAALAGLFYASRFLTASAGHVPSQLAEYVQIALFHVSLTLAYIITYSGLEADSPSLVMIKAVADAGPDGLGKELFEGKLTDEVLVRPRVNDLVRDGLAAVEGGRYRLTAKGRSFIRIFVLYRKLLNAPLKGG